MTSPDAPLLQQTNTLKEAVDESLLTPAQKQARNTVLDHRKDGAPFINLHGPHHAGKTFLCWVLHETEGWPYYQAVHEQLDNPIVIYDHADSGRRATRNLRNHASINGLATVVYVTNQPADELYPQVELRPGESHYEQVASTWENLGLDPDTAPTPIQ
jgi:hypothetical protein